MPKRAANAAPRPCRPSRERGRVRYECFVIDQRFVLANQYHIPFDSSRVPDWVRGRRLAIFGLLCLGE